MELNKEQIPIPTIEKIPDVESDRVFAERKERLARLKDEIEKLREFRLKSGYIEMLGDTRLGYRNEECAFIEKVINDFNLLLLDIEQDVEIHLGDYLHLQDIIINPLMAEIAYTSRIIKKLENAPHREDINEEEYHKVIEDTLTEEEKQRLLNFKEVTNYLIYYFDLIKNDRDILLQECGGKDGWLETYGKYYKEGIKLPNVNVFSQLQDINFFSRIKGRESSVGNRIKGMEEICRPISTEEEFEKAFEKLKNKNDLDKEAIRQDFLGKPEEFKKAA